MQNTSICCHSENPAEFFVACWCLKLQRRAATWCDSVVKQDRMGAFSREQEVNDEQKCGDAARNIHLSAEFGGREEGQCIEKSCGSPVCCWPQTVWCKHRNSTAKLENMVQPQKGRKIKKIKVLIIWSKGLSLFLSRYSSLSAALPPVSPLLSLLPSCCTLTTLTLQLHPLSPPLCPLPWWLKSNKMRLWNNREEGLPTPEFWPSDQL